MGPDGTKALCDIIKFHGKLETLKLGWCQVIFRLNHAFQFQAGSIMNQSVFFPLGQIGPKGAEYIADALKYNTTLSTLDLRANGLGDDVCNFLFKCI